MTIKIDREITDYELLKDEAAELAVDHEDTALESVLAISADDSAELPANVVQMHEKVERPEMLLGSTYKIKTPLSDHALYVTINDIILNPDTPYEKRRPFEIFINSKNMDHFQWIVALTRIISAVFRKGGDATFLVEELRSVFDPQGGYFKRGGKYTPSLVAEIGDAIEAHMKMIGMIKDETLDPHQQKLVDEKRREYQGRIQQSGAIADAQMDTGFPNGASLCMKCRTKAVALMDGCMTCLNCGDSKCG
ncbi:MAG: NrdJb [Gammaproteobacteria bacterium]|nr:NrdJb [Gammaproteobacteria bacterium]